MTEGNDEVLKKKNIEILNNFKTEISYEFRLYLINRFCPEILDCFLDIDKVLMEKTFFKVRMIRNSEKIYSKYLEIGSDFQVNLDTDLIKDSKYMFEVEIKEIKDSEIVFDKIKNLFFKIQLYLYSEYLKIHLSSFKPLHNNCNSINNNTKVVERNQSGEFKETRKNSYFKKKSDFVVKKVSSLDPSFFTNIFHKD